MKIKITITKKHLYITSGLIAALVIAIFVPADPDAFGHNYQNLDLGIMTIDAPAATVTVDGDMDVTARVTAHKITSTGNTIIEGDLEVDDNDGDDNCAWKTIPGDSMMECDEGRFMAGFEKPVTGTWSIYCREI